MSPVSYLIYQPLFSCACEGCGFKITVLLCDYHSICLLGLVIILLRKYEISLAIQSTAFFDSYLCIPVLFLREDWICCVDEIRLSCYCTSYHLFMCAQYLRGVPPEMSAVPTVYLSELMDALLHGCLSGRVVCVKGNFVSVQHACLQFMCQGCQHTSVDGSCMPTCLHKKPMLKAEARWLVLPTFFNMPLCGCAVFIMVTTWGTFS